MTTTERKQARRIAQEKSATAWLIAADALEDVGDARESARCRQVGELIGQVTDSLASMSQKRFCEFVAEIEGEKFRIRFSKRYCKVIIDVLVERWSTLRQRLAWYRMGKRYITHEQRMDPSAVYEKARNVVALTGLNVNLPR